MRQENGDIRISLASYQGQDHSYNTSALVLMRLFMKALVEVRIPMSSIDPVSGAALLQSKTFYVERYKTVGSPFRKNPVENRFSSYSSPNRKSYEMYLQAAEQTSYTVSYDEWVFAHTDVFRSSIINNMPWGEQSQKSILKRMREEKWIETKQWEELMLSISNAGGMEYTTTDIDGVIIDTTEDDLLDAAAGEHPFSYDAILRILRGENIVNEFEHVLDLSKMNDDSHGRPMLNNSTFVGTPDDDSVIGVAPLALYQADLVSAKEKLDIMASSTDIFTEVQTHNKGFKVNDGFSSLDNSAPQVNKVVNIDTLYENPYDSFEKLVDNNSSGVESALTIVDSDTWNAIGMDPSYIEGSLTALQAFYSSVDLVKESTSEPSDQLKYAKINGNIFLISNFLIHPFVKNGRNLVNGNITNNKDVQYSAIVSIRPSDNFYVIPEDGNGNGNGVSEINARDIQPTAMIKQANGTLQTYEPYLEIVKNQQAIPGNQVDAQNYANPRIDIRVRFGFAINDSKAFKIMAFEKKMS